MARKSTITIGLVMYRALEDFINRTINGTFYPPQTVNSEGGDVAVRGADADTEDAVLTVARATAGQVQDGTARLNIYVADIDCGLPNKVANTGRLQEIADKGEEMLIHLNVTDTDYIFDFAQAPTAGAVPGKAEHYVNFTFNFKRITFNY
jgi:hypothetical protein